jgi:hypothetical protein
MLSYMYDDAFYYLVPAYSFAHGAGWTLDHITPTAGFQPLYGYAAAVVSLVTGHTRAFPVAMMWASAVALLGAAWILTVRTSRLYGNGVASVAMLLAVAAPRAFTQITAGLEWGLSVLLTAVLVAALLRFPRDKAWPAIAALLLVLTRVDLAIFVAVFTTAVSLGRWRSGDLSGRQALVLLLSTALGAASALLWTGISSRAITGMWIPNSVAMKEYWSRSNLFQPALAWNRLLSCYGVGLPFTIAVSRLGVRSRFAMGGFYLLIGAVCAKELRHGPERGALAAASALAVTAYTLAYARGVNLIFDHYSAGILVPVTILTCGLLAGVGRHWRIAATACACLIAASAAVSEAGFPIGAHEVIARHARDMAALAPNSRIAGWNVGIASWETGGRVMNLDGLANAEVVEPIKTGSLACFLQRKQVTHLLDFGFMFPGQIDTGFSDIEDTRRQILIERNGYDPATLYRCTTQTASAQDDAFSTSQYRLFSLQQPCLAALCHK